MLVKRRSAATLLTLITLGQFSWLGAVLADTKFERQAPQNRSEVVASFSEVVKKTAPSVVNILALSAEQRRSAWDGHPLQRQFERFFGRLGVDRERQRRSLGSGVLVSPDGLIVTSAHVVKGAGRIDVVLTDRREYRAEVLLADNDLDLAVLKISGLDKEIFEYLELPRDGNDIEVGDLVLAIGNPYGVGQSVTSGIVSAVGRYRADSGSSALFIQTDAAINPGNSGGALVNSAGKLLGINTAIVSPSGGSAGIGFAIPSSVAYLIFEAARRGDDRLLRPWSGAQAQKLSPELALALGVKNQLGALIAILHDSSPLKLAGLRTGDVIVKVGDEVISSPDAFEFIFSTGRIGDYVNVTFIRNQTRRQVRVRLSPAPAGTDTPLTIGEAGLLAGVTIANISPAILEEFGLERFTDISGVVVTAGRNAGSFSIRSGDILLSVNNSRVKNTKEVQSIVTRSRITSVILRRGRQTIRLGRN